ncbi:MAG TPA: hypothetical protein VLU93_00085, partial [Candidatus Bathyarchaeia archaeon]|nr:hypothetical protein [Candidatus Bathyarchaeia archaeon]
MLRFAHRKRASSAISGWPEGEILGKSFRIKDKRLLSFGVESGGGLAGWLRASGEPPADNPNPLIIKN